ncbi:hypothetical protein DCC27_006110 [Auritidibacter sp. NML130574]|nr:hypothetical protein DCC27_006110 [Auritidibacter sp. NML130574]PXA78989.1 hypothetical protein DCC26_06235 [Auritidibacter sp. NML120779]
MSGERTHVLDLGGQQHQGRRWSGTNFESYRSNGGISHREWAETGNGAGYCLVAEGAWQTGRQYRLLFKPAGSDEAVTSRRSYGQSRP